MVFRYRGRGSQSSASVVGSVLASLAAATAAFASSWAARCSARAAATSGVSPTGTGATREATTGTSGATGRATLGTAGATGIFVPATRKLRGNRKSYIGDSGSNRNICTSNTEAIDRVSDIVHSLKNAISINILVATTGHAKSILCLSLGRVDVLIAKAKLAKFILSMELAGRGGWDSNRYRSRCNRKRGWGRCQSKRSRYLSKRKRDWGRSDRKRCRDLSNRSWGKVQRCRDLGERQSFRLRSWHK